MPVGNITYISINPFDCLWLTLNALVYDFYDVLGFLNLSFQIPAPFVSFNIIIIITTQS